MGDDTRLQEARAFMLDFALPPGYSVGQQDDGTMLVVDEQESSVFSTDATEAEVPLLAIDLWREYVGKAPPQMVARFAQCVVAVDALMEWDGSVSPGKVKGQYVATLRTDPGAEVTGTAGDPVEAILVARRDVLELLEDEDLERCDEGEREEEEHG
jgi:hypothetical protein